MDSDAAWSAAKADLATRIPSLAAYKGKLGTSAADLLAGLEAYMDLQLKLERLGTYASQRADEDARVSATGEMREEAQQLGVTMRAAIAFARPEIIALGPDKVRAFIAAEPRLLPYRPYLEDLVRYTPHTRTAAEEALIAQASRMAFAGGTIRNIFNNADMQWPTVSLSDGEKVRLDDAAYTRYRQAPLKADRDTVFHAFWRAHEEFQATYGAALNAGVQSHVTHRFWAPWTTRIRPSGSGRSRGWGKSARPAWWRNWPSLFGIRTPGCAWKPRGSSSSVGTRGSWNPCCCSCLPTTSAAAMKRLNSWASSGLPKRWIICCHCWSASARMRQAAALALAKIPSGRATPRLVAALLESDDQRVLTSCIEALGIIGDPEGSALLVEGLSNGQPPVRRCPAHDQGIRRRH